MALQTKPFLQGSRAFGSCSRTCVQAFDGMVGDLSREKAIKGMAGDRVTADDQVTAGDRSTASDRVYAMKDDRKHKAFSKNEILFC